MGRKRHTLDGIELEPWAIGMRPDDVVFVREFLIDMQAAPAMVRAGHSPESAQSNAFRMIRRPVIAKAIASAMTERAEAMAITAKTILGEAFRCYLAAAADKHWSAAAKFLEMCGKHVDVQAFRTQIGLSDPNGEPLEFDLSGMTTDEKRILLKAVAKGAGVEPASPYEGSPTVN